MRWKEITEAPIADFGTYGNMDQEGSFRSQDLKAMTNPKWQTKLHRMFEKTEFPINLYLVNAPNDRTKPGQFGNPDTEHSSYRDLSGIDRWSGIKSKSEVEALTGRTFMPADYEQAITVVLIENEGDERIALTPWMVAHRIAHAFFLTHDRVKHYDLASLVSSVFPRFTRYVEGMHLRLSQNIDEYDDVLEKYKEKYGMARFFAVCEFVGTTKGQKKLASPGEFLVEAFAQYMIQGRVKLERPEISGHHARRRPLTKEEHDFIHATAREFYHGSVDTYIQKHVPAPPKPVERYGAFDAEGMGVAAFSDPARIPHYESNGLTVKVIKPSWQAKKKYADWEAKVAGIREMWERLDQEGFMEEPLNRTESLDNMSEEFEKFMNDTCRQIMVRCIGKFLVL